MRETLPQNGRAIQKTREAAAAIGDRAHAGIDRLSAGAHDAVDRVASGAVEAADHLDVKREEWSAATDEWMDATRGYVREHPVAALAVALAAGYLLSRLTARS
jgi:ElaB/YqjD/DUF883 family membrane-anchored ribosome-binding protein